MVRARMKLVHSWRRTAKDIAVNETTVGAAVASAGSIEDQSKARVELGNECLVCVCVWFRIISLAVISHACSTCLFAHACKFMYSEYSEYNL